MFKEWLPLLHQPAQEAPARFEEGVGGWGEARRNLEEQRAWQWCAEGMQRGGWGWGKDVCTNWRWCFIQAQVFGDM